MERRVAFVLLAAMACGSEITPPTNVEPAPAPVVPVIGEHSIDIIVDGQKVVTLAEARLRGRVRLDELLPTTSYLLWSSIAAYGPGVGPAEWLDPSSNFAGLVPEAFLNGGVGAMALVELGGDPAVADSALRIAGIDEIHITLAPRPRTWREELADGCTAVDTSERPRAVTPRRWKGPSYNWNAPSHWMNDLEIDLGDGPAGARIGRLRAYTPDFDLTCVSELYRIGERNGRLAMRGVHQRNCATGVVELACKGDQLELRWYRSDGTYTEHGMLTAVP
ncbi:MAG: hypothetical protein SFX73_21595 [Kofleriaceae bacterium]|nr:hypothetical protein [Kofleriaceae bacterium]